MQLDNLIAHQRFLATSIGDALLGQCDPFALRLANQGPLELRERPMTDSSKFAVRELSPVELG